MKSTILNFQLSAIKLSVVGKYKVGSLFADKGIPPLPISQLFYYFLPETTSRNSLGLSTPNIKICHLPTEWKTVMPFLDNLVIREDKEFTTNIYRKPTFSGLYPNPPPPPPPKMACLTLLFRTYSICSDWSKIHTEIIKLSNVLIEHNFPSKFIDLCIKLFFDKLFSAKKKTVLTVPKKVVNISLPLLGKLSLKIRCNLIKLAKTYFPCCKIQVVFNSGNRLGNGIKFKYMLPLNVRSLLIYNFCLSRQN